MIDYNQYYEFLYSDRYWNSPSEIYVQYKKKMLILKYLQKIKRDNIRILDIGCNTGTDLFMYDKKLKIKAEYVGVDISSLAITAAKEYAKKENLVNFNFYKGDITKDNIEVLGKFDIIICSEVIEHIKIHGFVFENIHEVLNDNGYLILTTPDKDSLIKKILLKLFPIKKNQEWLFERHGSGNDIEKENYMKDSPTIHQHISEVDKELLRMELKASNFKIIKLKSSAITYGSPVLDNHPFIFIIWMLLNPIFIRWGYDTCVLCKKV